MAKSNKRPGRSFQLSGTLHPADQTSRLNDVRHPVPGVCRTRAYFPGGTDQRLGVSFDQQDGTALGDWTEYGVIGAYADTARHAGKCAGWCRTQDVAWRSSPRTGRAGFRLR